MRACLFEKHRKKFPRLRRGPLSLWRRLRRASKGKHRPSCKQDRAPSVGKKIECGYEEWEPTEEDIAAHGIETADGVYFLLNSTELRHINFPMDAVDPLPTAPVPIASRTRRSSAQAERPSTAGRRFCLPADIENQILALCW